MKKGVYLLLILLFPSIIYMIFSLGEHHVEKLEYFGDYQITPDGDSIYVAVPDFRFQDSKGHSSNLSAYAGKVLVVHLFETPCDSLCKKRGATIANYLNELAEPEKWNILSLSINAATNNQLEELRQLHDVGMSNWTFANTDDEQGKNSFLDYAFVQTGQVSKQGELPNDLFMLIDQEQKIRAFFDSRHYKQNRKLEDAIKLLLKEPHMSWKEE